MKKIPAVCLALTMLFTTACGVQQTPVTGTATPTPEPGTPEAAGFDVLTPVEGTDYTLSEHEISDAYTLITEGIVMKCLDVQAMNRGTHYAAYTVENGELVELERHTVSQDYELNGVTYPLGFEWCMNDGQLILPYTGENYPIAEYRYRAAPERVFVPLYRKDINSRYPVMLNLLTGEVTDVLSGVELENIQNINVSPSGNHLLLMCSSDALCEDVTVWHYDIAEKTLTDITDISPHKMGGTFVSDNIICVCEDGIIRRCNLETGELEELYNANTSGENVRMFGSSMTAGRYVLFYSPGRLFAVDVIDGAVLDIGAVQSEPYSVCYSIYEDKALLMFYDGTTVTGLSVVDFEAQTLSEYPVPEDFAVSAGNYSYPGISWLGSGVFALDNGADGTDDPLRLWAYELQTPSGESPDEVLVYPESSAYSNAELGISIDFPESWVGHLALLENYGAEPSVTVCCRELLEAESVPEYSIIFAVLSTDRNNSAALRRFDDPECFTLLGERGDLVYYYSNAYGRIKGAELWYKDVWDANKPLLTDMAEQFDTLMSNVEILSAVPSVDAADYGFTQIGPDLPDFASLELEALGAYYLNSDGAYSEGAIDELTRRFVSEPDAVLDYLLALGSTPAPHFPEESAAGYIAAAVALHAAYDGGELGEGFPAALASVSARADTQKLVALMEDAQASVQSGFQAG